MIEKQRRPFQERRQNILADREPLTLFRTALPERFQALLPTVGEVILAKVEKQITLMIFDSLWADFLEETAALREGIHLVQLGGKVPLDEFQKSVWDCWRDLQQRIEGEIVAALQNVTITPAGIDWEQEGIKGPSATWTYLMNDAPFGNKLEMFLAPFLKMMLKKNSAKKS